MDKRYQVFISSTFEDLQDERKAVIDSILDHDCFPSGMELFPASDMSQFEYIKSVIDESDYYILIVAGKYGSISENGISYTEMEYDYAVSMGIPILRFLHKKIGDISSDKTEKTELQTKKLENFRKKVSVNKLCNFYTSCDNLKNLVSKSLSHEIKVHPRTGWIRGDIEKDTTLLRQIIDLRTENDRLEDTISLKYKQIQKEVSDDVIQIFDDLEIYVSIDYTSIQVLDKSVKIDVKIKLKQFLEEFGYKIINGFNYDQFSDQFTAFIVSIARIPENILNDIMISQEENYWYNINIDNKTLNSLIYQLIYLGVVYENNENYYFTDEGNRIIGEGMLFRKLPF